MPKRKSNPDCYGYEFAARRLAAGIEHAKMSDDIGCSVSCINKWIGGYNPVSDDAKDYLDKVELAIEEEAMRIFDELKGEKHPVIEVSDDFEYGESAHEKAAIRARVLLMKRRGTDARINPSPSRIARLPSQYYAYDAPRDE